MDLVPPNLEVADELESIVNGRHAYSDGGWWSVDSDSGFVVLSAQNCAFRNSPLSPIHLVPVHKHRLVAWLLEPGTNYHPPSTNQLIGAVWREVALPGLDASAGGSVAYADLDLAPVAIGRRVG
jgi:hypothetical protein